MKIKKNDIVKIIAGAHKGKTGKVLQVLPAENQVRIEGIGQFTRHLKPSQLRPQGGTKDIHRPIHLSNVAVIVDNKPARVGYQLAKDGAKVRIARNQGNKEIK